MSRAMWSAESSAGQSWRPAATHQPTVAVASKLQLLASGDWRLRAARAHAHRGTHSRTSRHALSHDNGFAAGCCRREAEGLDRMVLVGHSLGSYVATCYAERHPEHVQQLVLTGTAGPPEPLAAMSCVILLAPQSCSPLCRGHGNVVNECQQNDSSSSLPPCFAGVQGCRSGPTRATPPRIGR